MRFLHKRIILFFILMLVGTGILLAKEKNLVILSAKQIQYDSKNNVLSLSGKVKLAYGEEVLEADLIVYDRRTDNIEAKGKVTLYCKGKTRFQAEYFKLTSNLKKGVAEELRGLIDKKARVSGRKMDYNRKKITTVDRALYSVCENCKKKKNSPLVWQIRTEKLEYDHLNEYITYKNASIELKGVPVFYTPYFAHPSPRKKRCSGFLFPQIGYNSDLGAVFVPGYLWALSPSKEFLMRTILTSSAGGILWGTYGARIMNGEVKLDSSIGNAAGAKYNRPDLKYTEDKEISRLRKRGWRGHCAGYAKKDINDEWRVFANLDWTSDKTYFAKYKMLRPNQSILLESNVGAEFFGDRSFATIKTSSFQNLSTTDVESNYIPAALPFGYGSFMLTPEHIGGQFEISAFATQMLYPHSFLERRGLVGAKWIRKFLAPGGHDVTFQMGGVADGYAATDSFSSKYKDLNILKNEKSVGRLYPKTSLFWRWPIMASDKNISCIFEPVVGTALTPVLKKKYADMINNSCMLARSFELNDVNYTSPSYYNCMADYMDNGSRVVCGLNTTTYCGSRKMLRTTVGQNYSMSKPQLNLSHTSGIRHRWSNFIGLCETYPSERSRVFYRCSYNRQMHEMTRQEAGAGVTIFKDTNLLFDIFRGKHYAIIDTKEHYKGYRGGVDAPIAGYWRGNYNIVVGEKHKTLNYHVGAKYEDECFIFNVWLDRNAYGINDVRPCTSVMFSIELKSIGQMIF
ncbi:MAG: LPS assembly protein LptD [Holosporales bacterium]|jgi:LPS-assembly protein|nr:LPS assembly protein LptD [Holosporales bacterium]